MKTYQQLQNEIGEWSQKNFGDQESKTEACTWYDHKNQEMTRTPLILGRLCPLMGMMEELGELFDREATSADQIDACADIGIYALDYGFRSGLEIKGSLITSKCLGNIPANFPIRRRKESVQFLGKLYHCELKHHQGIRGMDDLQKFNAERSESLYHFLACIEDYLQLVHECSLLKAINKTWDVVSQRDWNKDPETGGNHDHHTTDKKRPLAPEHSMRGHIAENDDQYDINDPKRRGE